ncbi:TonB-dependent receptor family protein [Yunchengibacter salinarum]|uniref:TonB-dependent receptor family protein n=1 Tax=Yunchengibacter salinarum TaxID=3133399 RepID=UPI0035B67EDE
MKPRRTPALTLAPSLIALVAAMPAVADSAVAPVATSSYESDQPIERLVIIGSKDERASIPGSATFLDKEMLAQYEYDDIHRILRLAPGVNIQEEDGFGLRPNIGLRGTSVERSEKITLMEDGVLIAPAPYAAPAAYYFPSAGRMESVEVSKGASAIRFGPRTVGGAINMLSSSIPEETGGFVDARFGERDNFTVHAQGGINEENYGLLVETYQSGSSGFKDLDGGGDTGFRIQDYLVKGRVNSDKGAENYHSFELKLGYTDNDSNETYLGLTDDDFRETPLRRYAASQNDNMDTKHKQIQGTYRGQYGDDLDLTVVAYYNDFARDWFKLDDLDFGDGRFRPSDLFRGDAHFAGVLSGLRGTDVSLSQAATERQGVLDVLKGNDDSAADTLQMRHNNREYFSAGIQGVLDYRFVTGEASHTLTTSLRYHADEEDRVQNRENFRMVNGTMVRTSVDPAGSHANRLAEGEALSAYVQDKIEMGRLTVTPGLRLEVIELKRTDFFTGDADRSEGARRVRENNLTEVVPGIGATYELNDTLTLLAGVHKGFNPPGSSDANAESETSVNYEAGLLYNDSRLSLELVGFYSDVSNLLGTCTAASGRDCDIGDQFNGGSVDVKGIEAVVAYVAETPITGVSLPVRLNYTLTDATFASTFSDSFWGDVTKGDEMPYIAEHQATLSTGLESDIWAVNVLANYTSSIRTDAGQGSIPGLERIGDRVVVDLSASYQFSEQVRLFGEALNVFDNSFAVARRPYGLRPGRPQTFIGGIRVAF